MALLDYLFPAQDNQLGGLLGMDDERLRRQAQQTGLLNMGLNIIAASGPSNRPQGLLQPVATGIMAGQQAYQGALDQQIQQAAARQKLEREANFRKAIEGAFTTRPTGTGLTQSGIGSQAEMLSRPEFGGDFGAETRAALLSNPNLPKQRVLDESKFMAALAEYNPLEFAKIQSQTQRSEKESFRPMTLDEKKQAGLPADRPYQISTTGKIQDIGTGPQSVVNVLPAEGERQKGYGKYGVEKNTQIFDAGQKAVQNIGKINETLNLLEQGSATTGLGADIINNINRAQVLFTGSKKKINEVSDTELLNSLLGADVFPQIGALGIGAKGLDTPAEREFLRQVMTGTINMNKETLLRLTKLRKKYEERSLGDYNKAVDEGQLDELFRFSGLPKRKLTAPTTAITVNY
ncbi:MAG: hypothetical protein EBU08_11375 [Micrococcales bacterium]|nr:hypothetical protein [Micrococcales bacterium]